jgi:hypothetical protein
MAAGAGCASGVSGTAGAAMLSDSQSIADNGPEAAAGVPATRRISRLASLVRIQDHRFADVALVGLRSPR